MRSLLHRGFSVLFDPPTKSCSAKSNQIIVNNAQNYTLEQIYHSLLIYFLSGSRTLETMNLRATASARRLCEN